VYPDFAPVSPAPHQHDRARQRLGWIEVSRAVAACLVVAYHVSGHVKDMTGRAGPAAVFRFGHSGVDLFFVISGFIILFVHHPDIGQPARLGAYLQRRAVRVFPIYWVATAAVMLISAVVGHLHLDAALVLRSITLLPTGGALILGVAWTLQLEILFYGLFTVLILNRWLGLAVLAVWATLIGAAAISGKALPDPFGDLGAHYNMEFLLGMAGAYAMLRWRLKRPGLVLAVGIALFAAAAMAEDTGWLDGYGVAARLAYGLPALLIVTSCCELSRARANLPPGWSTRLGGASYAIYLFQAVFIGGMWRALALAHLPAILPSWLLFGVLAAAPVYGGVIVTRYLEKPLMRAVRRALDRNPGPATTIRP
jgi:peptidoglycan/LPS O-acetylase OafA/YrhL